MTTIAKIRGGRYIVAQRDEKAGAITGDHSTGFWAWRNDGSRILADFDTKEAAAEAIVEDRARILASFDRLLEQPSRIVLR